jgi:hypothetical protein
MADGSRLDAREADDSDLRSVSLMIQYQSANRSPARSFKFITMAVRYD